MEKTSTVMNPWPGLASYSGEDGRTLYGRSREINEVYSLIRNNLFVTLYGRSGIGKTSLIKAGVSPYLKRSGYMPVYVRLAQEIRKEGETTFAGCMVRSIREAASKSYITFEEPPTVPDYLSPDALWHWFVSANLTTGNGNRIVPVIFLDQFEEVFSVDNKESVLLLRQLCALVDGKRRLPEGVDGMSSQVRIVVSMRDDSLYRIEDVIDAYNLFPLRQKRYMLKPLGEKAAAEVIATPVEGLVSEEVMSQIIEKVGGMGSGGGTDPAVLSLMMSELFKKSAGGPITSDLVAGMDSEIVDSFYREGTRNIPDKEMEFLETHLVTSDGRRSVVAAVDMSKNVSLQHLEFLLESYIISRLERGSFIDYELSHDVLCKRVTQNKLERERRRVKKRQLMMLGGVAVLLLLLAASVLTIKELRDRRWTMLENQSRYVAEKVIQLSAEGDNLLAQRLALETLPRDLAHQNRPYVGTAELALRLALNNNSGIIQSQSGAVSSANYSHNGKSIVSSSWDDNTVSIWDAETSKLLTILTGHKGAVNSAIFSPDDKYIISASFDGTIRIWNATTGDSLNLLKGHDGGVLYANYSPNGKRIVSASDDNTIRVWDTETGDCINVLKGHTGSVHYASYSSNCKWIVSSSEDKTIRIWNAETGDCIKRLNGHTGAVYSSVYSPDNKKILSSSLDGTVRVWDAVTGENDKVMSGHIGFLFANYNPDGKQIVSASCGYGVIVWDAENGNMLNRYYGFTDMVTSVSYSSDGRYILASSWDKTIQIFDLKPIETIGCHDFPVQEARYSLDDNRIVSCSNDKTIRIWNVESRDLLAVLKGHKSSVESVCFSPNGKWIVSASWDNTACIWDTDKQSQFKILSGHSSVVSSVCFSPNGKYIVSASWDKTIRIWDAETGETIKILKGHNRGVNCVAYSPDGKRIVSASTDGTIRVWDAETGSIVITIKGHESRVETAYYSSDGKWIVSASDDKTVRIWEAETGNPVNIIEGHKLSVTSAIYSMDCKRIVSSSLDGTVKIWNAETCEMLNSIKVSDYGVNFANYNNRGDQIIFVSSDGSLGIMKDMNLQTIVDQTSYKYRDYRLTESEKKQFYIE